MSRVERAEHDPATTTTAGSSSLREQIAFYLILGTLAALAIWLVHSYLGAIIFSLTAVIVLKPLYDRLLHLSGGRSWLAIVLALLICLLLIIIPLIFVSLIVISQLAALADSLQQQGSVARLIESINRLLQTATGGRFELGPEISNQISGFVITAASWLATQVINLAASFPGLITRAFVFLGIVGALLPNYHTFVARLKRLSPLDDAVDDLFLRKIKLTVWSMFIGIFVIAIIQGLATGVFFWLADVPYAPLWTLLAVLASMFPLGAAIVALPVGLFELATGDYLDGLIVLGGYLLVVSNLDSLIRPRLVSREAYLSFALLLLSAVGGLELFGFFGVVYGPVLMIMFLTAVDVYEEHYAEPPRSARESWSGVIVSAAPRYESSLMTHSRALPPRGGDSPKHPLARRRRRQPRMTHKGSAREDSPEVYGSGDASSDSHSSAESGGAK